MELRLTIKIPKDNDLTEYISSNESTPPPPPPSLDDESPTPPPPLDDTLFDLSDDSVYNDISNAQDISDNQESPYGFELSAPTLVTSNYIVSEYIISEHTEDKESNCSCWNSTICSITGLIIFSPIIIIVIPFYSVYRILKFIF
jgi:hypothetical protein